MTDLPAGEELDRMVAEEVMGWKYDGVIQRTPGQGGPCDSYINYEGKARYFQPSRKIDHAWEVMERMRLAPGSTQCRMLMPMCWWRQPTADVCLFICHGVLKAFQEANREDK